MLKLNDVTWLYQHLPMRFTLDVARGERIAVLGPSGAGKSTLLNLIAGFLPPASGSLRINGEVHNATPPAQRPVSMLFQENNLFNHLTVRQNISLGIHPGLKLSREQQAQVRRWPDRWELMRCWNACRASFPAVSGSARAGPLSGAPAAGAVTG
ncbi:thiamin ABC transporter, ATPase component thiQ [Klebsiella variicola]|nr:thiamin ABC transporter, ATPase component thiQ [Klebsiella variicola]